MLECLSHSHRVVRIDVIRFVKAVLSLKDDFYHRHIVKGDLLRPLLQGIDGKDNLASSLLLDLVEFVRREKIFILTEYLVKQYPSSFDLVLHADSFDRLHLMYEQMIHEDDEKKGDPSSKSSGRTSQLEEDAYFDTDDGNDDNNVLGPMPAATTTSALGMLLDSYGEEEIKQRTEGFPKRKRDELLREDLSDPPELPLPPLRPKFDIDDDVAPVFTGNAAVKSPKGNFACDQFNIERKPKSSISFKLTTKNI